MFFISVVRVSQISCRAKLKPCAYYLLLVVYRGLMQYKVAANRTIHVPCRGGAAQLVRGWSGAGPGLVRGWSGAAALAFVAHSVTRYNYLHQ
jgi:hypothetical protein